MLKSIVKALLLVLILLWLTVAVLACGSSGKDEKTNEANSWILRDGSTFGTNDLALAQGEMPFTIIAPTYLPENLPSKPSTIAGRARGHWPEEELEVHFSYQYHRGGIIEGAIWILEGNVPFLDLGSGGSDVIEIDGTIVVVERESMPRRNSKIELNGFSFQWNQNDISVTVGIYGYDYDEALKVVESMVEQGQKEKG